MYDKIQVNLKHFRKSDDPSSQITEKSNGTQQASNIGPTTIKRAQKKSAWMLLGRTSQEMSNKASRLLLCGIVYGTASRAQSRNDKREISKVREKSQRIKCAQVKEGLLTIEEFEEVSYRISVRRSIEELGKNCVNRRMTQKHGVPID